MPSVIIPAHNEESNILHCLSSLEGQIDFSNVIVACNGCDDRTYELVLSKYPNIKCLNIDKPSKTNAINIAETFVTEWPVFYLDADCSLSESAISSTVMFFEETGKKLLSPSPVIDTSLSPLLVRCFYNIWLKLPYVKQGVIATCTYVISEESRKRFDIFPDVIADDNFVRSQFKESEISNVPNAFVYVNAPKDIWSLIKIKTRSRLGTMQIRDNSLYKHLPVVNYKNSLRPLFLSKSFFSACIYVAFVAIFRLRAKLQYKTIDNYKWESDRSSR